MTDSDDRTEAPVSNEELYVQLKKMMLFLVGLASFICAVAGYVVLALVRPESGHLMLSALIVFAVVLYGLMGAYDDRGLWTAVYDRLPGEDVDETVEELEDRLTSDEPAVADGGDRE